MASLRAAMEAGGLSVDDAVDRLDAMGVTASRAGVYKLLSGRVQISALVDPLCELLRIDPPVRETRLGRPMHERLVRVVDELTEDEAERVLRMIEVFRR